MAYVIDGVFKIRRNKTHILKVKTDIEKEELIEKAIIKHRNFDQSFDRVSPYVLLYPEFREVNFVPGTEEIFSLVKYKEARLSPKTTRNLHFTFAFVMSFSTTSFLTGLLLMTMKRTMTLNMRKMPQ